jgi:hypothetical protein
MSTPRVVEIIRVKRRIPQTDNDVKVKEEKIVITYCTATPPPAWLRVCHESREEAKKRLQMKLPTSSQRYPIWVDPTHDEIFLRCLDYQTTALFDELFGVRYLAVGGSYNKNLLKSLSPPPNLRF